MLPDPRQLPPDVRAAAAWAAHEAWDVAPWPDLEYWNPEVSLRRHQRTASAFMYLGGLEGTLLADTVGTGKTFCAAATLAMCAQNGELNPGHRAVVACGAAAVGQWARELRRALPGIPVMTAVGTRRERVRAYMSPWQVLVVSSAVLPGAKGRTGDEAARARNSRDGDIEVLSEFPAGILIYDDIDPMRHRDTATARAIRQLANACDRVHGLHGTALQKRLAELYCAMEPVGSRDIFGTLDEFRQRYVTQERTTIWIPVRKAFPSERAEWARRQGFATYAALTAEARADREAGRITRARTLASDVETGRKSLQRVLWKDNGVNQDRLPEFQRLIAPVVLRRRAEDLEDVEMPDVQPAPRYLPLNPAQRARYDELKTGVVRMLRGGQEEVTHAKAAAAWTRGAQICSGLAALDDGPGSDDSAKLDQVLADVTGDLCDEKVIVFVYYKPNVAALSARLTEAGVGHSLLWGETRAKDRDAAIARFWEDPSCRVFAGTTSMAKSINLQVARHLVTADWVMNAATMEQIVGRAKRQGSAHATVFWHQYLTPDTQEDSYLDLLRGEAAMANSVWGEENAVFDALTPAQVLGIIAGRTAA